MVGICFDTSVFIAGLIKDHVEHETVQPWFKRVLAKKLKLTIAAHTLAECYAVLTTYPIKPKITPGIALELLESKIFKSANIVSLTSTEYTALLSRLANIGIVGGNVYDAIILRSAEKAKVKQLLTLNFRHFQRINTQGKIEVITP